MRRAVGTVLAALLLAAPAWPAAPKVKGDKVYRPHQKIVLTAEEVTSKAAQFLWDVDGTGEVETEEVGNKLYVWAPPGKYRVVLTAVDFESKKIERARTTFTVTGNGPAPPDPPGPGPAPDPLTALQKAARDAYALENDTEKAKHAKGMAAVYRAAAKAVEEQRPATAGAVWAALKAGAKAAGVEGKLPLVQAALATELKKLPSKSTDALDEAKRAQIAATLSDCALALEKLATAKGGR